MDINNPDPKATLKIKMNPDPKDDPEAHAIQISIDRAHTVQYIATEIARTL